jgi:hypothetical protein
MSDASDRPGPFEGEGETPWEPPFAGAEIEALLGALDRLRWTFRYKADDLDPYGLSVTVGASSLTLGGLLKHLAAAEDTTFGTKLSGTPLGEPWTGWGWDGTDDWELTSAAGDPPEVLYRTYDDAVTRARERVGSALASGGLDQALASGGLDQRVHVGDGAANLRRLVCDMIEEYGRHTGHADLLREAVDGRVGEDPPEGWRPVS